MRVAISNFQPKEGKNVSIGGGKGFEVEVKQGENTHHSNSLRILVKSLYLVVSLENLGGDVDSPLLKTEKWDRETTQRTKTTHKWEISTQLTSNRQIAILTGRI